MWDTPDIDTVLFETMESVSSGRSRPDGMRKEVTRIRQKSEPVPRLSYQAGKNIELEVRKQSW